MDQDIVDVDQLMVQIQMMQIIDEIENGIISKISKVQSNMW